MEIEKVNKKKGGEVLILKPVESNTKKINKEKFKQAVEILERLSAIIDKLDEETILFALATDKTLKKRLPSLLKQNVKFGSIIDEYLKNKTQVNALIKEIFKGTIAEKEFGEIKSFKDLLKTYLKIIKNEHFIHIINKIKEERPDLIDLIDSFDIILLYLFIKKILPLLIASGFSSNIINQICNYLTKVVSGGKILSMRKLLTFLPKLREYLYIFGTPDGKAVLLFLEGKPWE